ncbi:MAG: TolC family protein [Deltaproteobacteria bacterium]|nr:TolC family protein [Deltaproteobacteria bacterium]
MSLPRRPGVWALVVMWPFRTLAAEPPSGLPLAADPLVREIVEAAWVQLPELLAARAAVQAASVDARAARALPDPVLSFGIQNDGFTSIQIGSMESSYLTVMGTQTFPWPGKLELRANVAKLGARQAAADLERAGLSVRAAVERAFVELVWARDQRELVGELQVLWARAERFADGRYRSGSGSQGDVLRAQLELGRLEQRAWSVEADEARQIIALNRLAGRPHDNAIPATRPLLAFPEPVFETDPEILSPELARLSLATDEAAELERLAEKDFYPDISVGVGIMPRWGQFEPMWQANVAFAIPVWAASKQSAALEASRLRAKSARRLTEAFRSLLRQRVRERQERLEALRKINSLYRDGLLVQASAVASSALAQYEAGQAAFSAVLSALNAYVADVSSFHASLATVQRIGIADREVSVEPTPAFAVASGSGMPSAEPGLGEPPPSSGASSQMSSEPTEGM